MKTKIKPINGWTQAKMLERVRKYVPENERCVITSLDGISVECVYFREGNEELGIPEARCAIGAFLDEDVAKRVLGTIQLVILSEPDLQTKLPLASNRLMELQEVHDRCFKESNVRDRVISWIKENVE